MRNCNNFGLTNVVDPLGVEYSVGCVETAPAPQGCALFSPAARLPWANSQAAVGPRLLADTLGNVGYNAVNARGQCSLDLPDSVYRIDEYQQVLSVEGLDETAGNGVASKPDV
jgi:hypothetical protein